MKFFIENGIRIAEVPAKDFRVILYDDRKKSMGKNRCTGGFFGTYTEKGESFTLPAGHLVCDFDATCKWTKYYCQQRGQLIGKRFWFDSGIWEHGNELYKKKLTTLVVTNGKANVQELSRVPALCGYAISGVPVLRNSEQVQYLTAKIQGWSASSLYATHHVFVGVKENDASTVYVMGMKTSTANLLATGEAARKFKALGLRDVIKLDGGGSFYFDAAGNTLSTSENRRICTIIDMGAVKAGNPYAVPTQAIRLCSSNTTGVCWLQWELTAHGFPCTVDGSFGPATLKQLKAYQKANDLVVDGSCGPATRASLLTK